MWGLCTDLHAGVYKAKEEWTLIFKEWSVWAANKWNDRGVDRVIITGDVFEDETSIDSRALNSVMEVFMNTWKDFDIHIIVGNHDTFYKTKNDIYSLKILEGLSNVTIYSKEPTLVDLDGAKAMFLPWSNVKTNETIKDLGKADVCFCHEAIRGFELRKGTYCESHLTKEAFTNFKKVYSGHFHLYGQMDNITYLGSPYHLSANDTGYEKYIGVIDPKTCEIELIQNDISPQYIKIGASEINVFSVSEEVDNNHVILINDCDTQQEFYKIYNIVADKATTIRERNQPRSSSIDGSEIEEAPEDISKVSRAMDTLTKYVEESDLEDWVNKDTLLNLMESLLPDNASSRDDTGSEIIEFSSTKMQHFLSVGFEEVEIKYDPSGMYMVKGINLDRGGSNGSGKTSILLDAILFCLFGKTFKPLSKQMAVACGDTDGRTMVETNFKKGKNKYRIVRYLSPSSLELYINGELEDRNKNQTQDKINDILCFDYSVYQTLMAVNIAKMESFVSSTAESRRMLWNKVLCLDEYVYMSKKAKHLLTNKEDGINGQISLYNGKLSTAEENVLEIKELIKKSAEDKKKKISDLQKDIDSLKAPIKGKKDKKSKLDLEIKKMGIAYKIAYSQLEKEMEPITQHMDDCDDKVAESKFEIKELESKIKRGKEEIESIKQDNATCSKCGAKTTKAHKKRETDRITLEVEQHTANLVDAKGVLKDLQDHYNSLTKKKQIIESKQSALTINKETFVNGRQDQSNELDKDITAAEAKIEVSEKALANLKKDDGVITKDVVMKAVKNLKSIESELDRLKSKRKYLELCVETLSDSNIRAYIMSMLTPSLNSMLAGYLRRFGMKYTAEFGPDMKVKVKYPRREFYESGSLSGGEAMSLNWSILATYIKTSLKVGVMKSNFMVLDEVLDTSVDMLGVGVFMDIVKELQKEHRLSIFITSHKEEIFGSEQASSFNKVVITKKDEFSTIEQVYR